MSFSNIVMTSGVLFINDTFYNCGHISSPKRSTVIYFSAFDNKHKSNGGQCEDLPKIMESLIDSQDDFAAVNWSRMDV